MSSVEGLNVPINVNVTGAAQAQTLVAVLRELGTVFATTAGQSAVLQTKTKEVADAESATLSVYSRALKVLTDYSTASESLSKVQATETETVNRLSSALETLAVATTSVSATDKETAAAQSNTLRLYQQVLTVSQQSVALASTEAQTKLTLARAETELAKAKTETAKATQAEITAQRLANGQGAPLNDQQAALLAMRSAQQAEAVAAKEAAAADKQAADAASQVASAAKQAATARAAETAELRLYIDAARAAATADQFSAQGARDAQIAATQKASAMAQASQAEREEAAAARQSAQAQSEQEAGFKSTANTAGSAQFALYQVAYAYKFLSQAALAAGTAPIAVAESFQTSFAQVVRTLDVGAAGIQGFQGNIGVLRNSLIALSESIPVAFESLSSIATTGNQLGIAAGDVENFTNVVARFSALTNVSADAAATYFGRITNLLGVLPSQYSNLASAVVDLGVKSAATETEILAVTQNISGAVRTAGFGVPEVLGLATALASLKIPPELARGTLTRVLSAISTAAVDGGPKLAAYANVMGITIAQAQALQKESPEAFFQALIKGLSQVNINGGNLNKTLGDIGISSVRDQSLVQKLAGNYDLLAGSVREGVSAFAANTELSRQSEYVFTTLSAKVQETKDAFAAFLDSIGNQTLGPLSFIVDAVKGLLQAFTALPDAIKNPVFALAIIVGAIAAFRAALALGAAGIIAFRQVVGTELGASGLTISSFFSLLRNESSSAAAVVSESADVIQASNARIATSSAPVVAAAEAEAAALLVIQANAEKVALSSAGFITANRLTTVGLTEEAVALNAFNAELGVHTTAETLAAEAGRLQLVALGLESKAVGIGELAYIDETAAIVRNTAVLYENAAAARTNAVAQETGAVASAGAGVAKSVGGLAGFFGGPWGIAAVVGVTALTAVLPSLLKNIHGVDDASVAAAAHAKELSDAFITAVGGSQALSDAVKADTQALIDANGKTTQANGITQQFVTTVNDLHNGQAAVTQGWEDMAGHAIGDATTKNYAYADSATQVTNASGVYINGVKGSAAAQDALGHSVGLTKAQLDQQTIAIGNNAKALAVTALFDQTVGKNNVGGIFSQEQLTDLGINAQDIGKQIGDGLNAGLAGQEPKLNAQFKKIRADLETSLAAKQDASNISGLLDPDIAKIQGEITSIDKLQEASKAAGSELLNTSAYITALSGVLKAAGVASDDFVVPTEDSTNALTALGVSATNTTKQMKDLSGSFSSAIGDMFTLIDNVGALTTSLENLGKSIADNGKSFSTSSDAGRQNLAALESVVNAQAKILEKGITDGTISAEDASKTLGDFMTKLTNQLASQGVDTSQIAFLVDYVDRVTHNPAIWSVGVDVSSGIAGINQLLQFAQQAQAYVAGLGATYQFGQDVDKAASIQGSRTGANGLDTLSKYGTPPSFDGTTKNGQTSAEIIQQATNIQTVADEWKKAETAAQAATSAARADGQATNDAAKQAKQASTAAADAAKQASDVQAKHLEYLKAVGSYYGTIGKEAFAASDAQNNVIVKLQALGTSIANNGTIFSNTTTEGQANISALSSTFDAYGATLSSAISDGTLSVDQAQQKLQVFGAGVRQSLASAGVPAKTLDQIFAALGITGTQAFQKNNAETAKYVGVLTDAQKAAEAAFNTGTIDKASAATKQLLQYTKDLAAFYATLGTNLFSAVDAEGSVFASIQKLGDSIANNGKGFNTVTQTGRDNLSALESTLQAESKLLSDKVGSGKETATQAAKDFSQFAGGIYAELIKLGISATSVRAIFTGLGIDPKGFTNASASVKQYSGVLTDAEKAAAALTAATNKQAAAMAAAADYAKRLTDQLSSSYDGFHSLADAADATQTAIHGIQDSYTKAKDAVQSLRDANRGLNDDIAAQQATVDKTNNDYLLALKYGQAGEAADLKAQRDAAQTKIDQDKTQVAANNTQITAGVQGIGNLKGNTQEAIDNRKSLEDLQSTMLTQIETYAKTGASTKQVTDFTAALKKQFDDTALQAGYSAKDIAGYNKQFDAYVTIVKQVPQNIVTNIGVQGVSSATAALNSLPTSGSYVTTATADVTNAKNELSTIPLASKYQVTAETTWGTVGNVTALLNHIPKSSSYRVTAVVGGSPSAVGAAIRGAVGGGTNYTVNPVLSAAGKAALVSQIRNLASQQQIALNGVISGILNVLGFNVGSGGVKTPTIQADKVYTTASGAKFFNQGGLVGKYASGGLVPGTPPANPRQDNVLAQGPSGFLGIRSGEYIQPQPAVDYYGLRFMDDVRQLRLPRFPQFYAGGPAGGSAYSYNGGGSGGGGGQSVIPTGLSAADRRAMIGLASRPVNVTVTTQQIQRAQTDFHTQQSQAGRN